MANKLKLLTTKTIIVILVACAIAIYLLALAANSYLAEERKVHWISDMVFPFLVGLLSSVIAVLFNVRPIKEMLAAEQRERQLKSLSKFWTPGERSAALAVGGGSPRMKFYVIFGSNEKGETDRDPDPVCRYSVVYCVSRIAKVLELVHGADVEVTPVLLTRDEAIPEVCFRNGHVVILGGQLRLPPFKDLNFGLKVPYYHYNQDQFSSSDFKPYYMQRNFQEEPTNARDLLYGALNTENRVVADFGTITRVCIEDRLLVLFNGNHGPGLLAGVLAATSHQGSAQSAKLITALESPEGKSGIQWVVECVALGNQKGSLNLSNLGLDGVSSLTVRDPVTFYVERKQYDAATATCSKRSSPAQARSEKEGGAA